MDIEFSSKQKQYIADRNGYELEIISWFDGPREVRTITIKGYPKMTVSKPGPGVTALTFGF